MPRTFFSKASAGFVSPGGPVIMDIQLALNAFSAGHIDTDGLFGKQTETALSVFQASNGYPVSGTVTDTTWVGLMHSAEPAIFERCLQVTASFEGTGFTEVVGNFDGAGVTWGIIGFTLMNGELGAILAAINQRYPDLINKAFGGDAAFALQICGPGSSRADKLQWADSISRGKQKYSVAEPWKTYFRDLGSYREVQKLQIDRARSVYWTIAKRDAQNLGMSEELDFMLLYDTAVQNGGMNSKGRLATARTRFANEHATTPLQKREIVSDVVAVTSAVKYQGDVRSRKLAISTGSGIVHGGHYSMSNWGLLDGHSPAVID